MSYNPSLNSGSELHEQEVVSPLNTARACYKLSSNVRMKLQLLCSIAANYTAISTPQLRVQPVLFPQTQAPSLHQTIILFKIVCHSYMLDEQSRRLLLWENVQWNRWQMDTYPSPYVSLANIPCTTSHWGLLYWTTTVQKAWCTFINNLRKNCP